MDGTPQPRRALDPLPDAWDEPAAEQPSAASPAEPDDSAMTDTATMRRLAFGPDESARAATAVPPPRPVLPVWEPLPASAGRRFSADDAPYDSDWAAPRRSAASVTSPMSEYEPLLPPVSRPHAPPPVTVPYQPLSRPVAPAAHAPGPVPSMAMPTEPDSTRTLPTPDPDAPKNDRAARGEAKQHARDAARAEAQAKADAKAGAKAEAAKAKADAKASRAAAQPTKAVIVPVTAERALPAADQTGGRHAEVARPSRVRRIVIIAVAVVAAIALIATAVLWAVNARGGGAVTNPDASAVDPLLAPTDLTVLGGTWQEAAVTRQPLCVGQEVTPAAQRTASRMLASGTSSALQVVYTFADESSAEQAYAAELAEAGTCSADTALIVGASTVKGLADSADATRLTIQGAKDEHHVLLLTRSGRTVNTFDVTSEADLPVANIAQMAASALTRQCSSGSTCPSTVEVSESIPAAGDPAGWLVPADLPQITPGSGKWSALPIQAIALEGSQCEDMDLSTVSGTTTSNERVFVLTGDAKAPAHFGLDHAVWAFPTAKSAKALADKLTSNISDCAKTVPTATVEAGPSVKGNGQGTSVIGRTWEITHKLSTGTIVFRVAVVTSGTRVSYLLANPTKDFDFSDPEWAAVSLRAGQRASQAG